MKQLDVKSQRELEQELTRLGSSMDDAEQSFNEHVIASEWIRSKIKVSEDVDARGDGRILPDRIAKSSSSRRKVRWEELMVRKSGIPARQPAGVRQAGQDGKRRLAADATANPPASTPIFADVAKAQSEGSNAKEGGLYDWTSQGLAQGRR